MEINVYTNKKRMESKITEAAEFFARQLMHSRMVDNIELDIEIHSNLDCQGECINEDDTKRSRFFTIQLRNSSIDTEHDIIQTLAHEMVHLKQYAKNEHTKSFSTAKGGIRIENVWMGKPWRPKQNENIYYDSPWEIEAYGREVGLMARWNKYLEGKKTKPNKINNVVDL